MTESMKVESRALAIIPRTLDEVTDLAERLSKSELLPKELRGKVSNVLVTIMAGQEMGLTPMASLRNFHVIEGKPILSADGMVALVLGSGKAEYFERVAESEKSVTYETLRKGSKTPRRCTWTIEQAKAAGIHLKDNWRAYPRAMLAARAKAELARDVYPDVIAGCFTEDEHTSGGPEFVRVPVEDPNADALDAEIVDETKTDAALNLETALGAIEKANSVEDLKAVGVNLISKLGLTGADKTRANDAYKARLAVLRELEAQPQTAATTQAEPVAEAAS